MCSPMWLGHLGHSQHDLRFRLSSNQDWSFISSLENLKLGGIFRKLSLREIEQRVSIVHDIQARKNTQAPFLLLPKHLVSCASGYYAANCWYQFSFCWTVSLELNVIERLRGDNEYWPGSLRLNSGNFAVEALESLLGSPKALVARC